MTEEEIETVAKELAKVGGTSWYPGRGRGLLLRVVNDRFRDRARVAIAALDRLRASREEAAALQDAPADASTPHEPAASDPADRLQVGTIVVYRPPTDQRAIPCRIEKLEGGRAYLVPCPHPDVGWVSVESLGLLGADNDRE